MKTRLLAYLASVLLTYIVASIAATQSVLLRLQEMGMVVTWTDNLQTTGHDLLGFAGSFLLLILLAFALALPIAALISRYLPGSRMLWCTLAGFVAMLALHQLMWLALQVHPIAASRTAAGLLVQGVAGAIGGYCYFVMTRSLRVRRETT